MLVVCFSSKIRLLGFTVSENQWITSNARAKSGMSHFKIVGLEIGFVDVPTVVLFCIVFKRHFGAMPR